MPLIARRTFLVSTAALMSLPHGLALAGEHKVDMLNKHPENPRARMVFHPQILKVAAGDTVVFLPTDRGHNSESIKAMLPDGAEGWKGGINKEISVTLAKPGFYGYKCTPHETAGMVGLIVVEGDGMMDNLEAAKAVKHRGRARKVFEEIWAAAEADGLTG